VFQNIDYKPRYGDRARAIFEKMTHITEVDGNDINDATIKVSVDFDKRFDFKNGVKDEEEGMIYDFDETKAEDFIEKLINRTYGEGTRRKTRKNKRK
jgi:hypothetical protein